jgi:RHS repeat-associated protein
MKRLVVGLMTALLSISQVHATTVDPGLSRFVEYDDVGANAFAESVDGIPRRGGHPSDWNAYNYARNNPLKYTDPTGEFPVLVIAGIIIGGLLASTPTDTSLTPGQEAWIPIEGALEGGTIAYGACRAGGYAYNASFKPGGLFNANRYLRIGESNYRGRRVFRVTGDLINNRKTVLKDLGPQ